MITLLMESVLVIWFIMRLDAISLIQDALALKVGRTDFPLSNPKNFEKSIAKILELPHDTLVYPGHTYESSSNDMFTIGDWYR